LLSAEQTQQMVSSFSWKSAQKVAAVDDENQPTLYYAWVYVRSRAEALALKQLYIHVLNRPLFSAEFDEYAGRCGTFSNPGDGEGAFVPVLMPGDTYNKLIDALTSDEVRGDRVVFDAVILRDVPAEARTPQGSVRLESLAESGFRYLGYEVDPLKPAGEIQLDSGVSKALADALTWMGGAARNGGQFFTNLFGGLDRLLRGKVTMTLHLHAITQDPEFGGHAVMQRGWGSFHNTPLGARGMEVTIVQKLLGLPIPATSQGDTDRTGKVVIDAVEDGKASGSGLCIELKTRAAMVTDFLLPSMLCDLRQWDPAAGEHSDLHLRDFSQSREVEVQIDNARVSGLYQSDDVFRWSQDIAGFEPKRARILSGYWASTFSTDSANGKRLFAPCLNYRNSVSDALTTASLAGGLLATLVIPEPLTPIVTTVFGSLMSNSDIVMSTRSKLRYSRNVMSHEYGHYMFCSLLNERNASAVDHVVWATIAQGDDLSEPLRYTNEAMAEFFTGQVTGGTDYGWLEQAEDDRYCIPRPAGTTDAWCWDENLRAKSSGPKIRDNIGRIATLIHDAFDGHNAARGALVPGDGDVWMLTTPGDSSTPLIFSPTGYGNTDEHLERVALGGEALRDFVARLADGLGLFGTGDSITDARVFAALNDTMAERGISWCDRCRVLALHSTALVTENVRSLFETCVNDGLVAGAVGAPPEPTLRLDAASCELCPPRHGLRR
ncbi:hypothetical protein ACFL5O_10325, partial [Myxococcota bacterium]